MCIKNKYVKSYSRQYDRMEAVIQVLLLWHFVKRNSLEDVVQNTDRVVFLLGEIFCDSKCLAGRCEHVLKRIQLPVNN